MSRDADPSPRLHRERRQRVLDALAFAYDNLELVATDLDRERIMLDQEQGERVEDRPLSTKERAVQAKARQGKLPFGG